MAILVNYIHPDTLLKGYNPEPVYDAQVICPEGEKADDAVPAGEILHSLESIFPNLKEKNSNLDFFIGESVANIRDYGNRTRADAPGCGRARFYVSESLDRVIGAYELNSSTQLNMPGMREYLKKLGKAKKSVEARTYDTIAERLDIGDKSKPICTSMLFRSPAVKTVGVTEFDGTAYFFFEYELS